MYSSRYNNAATWCAKIMTSDMLCPLDQRKNIKFNLVPCVINRWCMLCMQCPFIAFIDSLSTNLPKKIHLIDFALDINHCIRALNRKLLSVKESQISAKHLVCQWTINIFRLRDAHHRNYPVHSKNIKETIHPQNAWNLRSCSSVDNSRTREYEITT